MKLIIDTDPGIDDAMAIAYAAAAPEIDLIGLTTVFGNTLIDQSSRNARFLLDKLNLTVPVSQGASWAWGRDSHRASVHVHGPEGFGDVTDIPDLGKNHHMPAAEYLVEMARCHKGQLTVCAVGPLTNIADAIALDPAFSSNLARLVIMGGAVFCRGNVTQHAEANIHNDPIAAQSVFDRPPETVLVGLDVTMQTLYQGSDFDALAKQSPDFGGFLRDISDFYLRFYQDIADQDGCGLHDSTAVIACSHEDMFETVETGVRVVQDGPSVGRTVPDPNRPAIKVCQDVDAVGVVNLFTERLSSLP
ncbi:nucleoside hydrolase [Ruegeria arenilitoris]|uniref:nucleoside hydrolase n=1 Tax=Ruegeria arenilitoris TaxID=1173585 RepID=UPI00147CEBD4|nr:nucleoside hydrolase [Ruegeria arenilitoris]